MEGLLSGIGGAGAAGGGQGPATMAEAEAAMAQVRSAAHFQTLPTLSRALVDACSVVAPPEPLPLPRVSAVG